MSHMLPPLCLLSAILSDCERTVDAINLAVRWKDPAIIREQLEDSKDADPVGISKAFERALMGRDTQVCKALIRYNAREHLVSTAKLLASSEGAADDAAQQYLSARWASAAPSQRATGRRRPAAASRSPRPAPARGCAAQRWSSARPGARPGPRGGRRRPGSGRCSAESSTQRFVSTHTHTQHSY